jgi:hypothetical protein
MAKRKKAKKNEGGKASGLGGIKRGGGSGKKKLSIEDPVSGDTMKCTRFKSRNGMTMMTCHIPND